MDFDRDSYRAHVARVFGGRDRETVFNGTIEHARIVTEEAFKAAKGRIRILSNKLDPACYGTPEVLNAAVAFMSQPEAQLDVLIEDGVSVAGARNIFLKTLHDTAGSRVKVSVVPEDVVKRYSFNFMSVDGEAYRFESDRANPIAVVGNDRETATHLAGLFEDLWGLAQPQLEGATRN